MHVIAEMPHMMGTRIFNALLGPSGPKPITKKSKLVKFGKELDKRCTLTGITTYPVMLASNVDGIDAALSEGVDFITATRRKPSVPRIHQLPENRRMYYIGGMLYLTGPPTNEPAIERLRQYKDQYFCNVRLMAVMLYLHEDTFQVAPPVVLDMFLGKGGMAIAGLAYGVSRVVGFEIDRDNYHSSKKNLETYLVDTGSEFENKGDKSSAHYTVQANGRESTIDIYHANSITDSPAVMKELAIPDYQLISDIPWGCHKCNAVAGKRITSTAEMRNFTEELEDTILSLSANQITLAQHSKNAFSTLSEVARIGGKGIYDIVMYQKT